jgi:hypothetical protein
VSRRPLGGGRGPAIVPVLAAVVVAAAAGCARPGAPIGGPPDRRPPVVDSVEPAPFSTVEPGDRKIRVRFNERISERPAAGTLAGAVSISPRTGQVSVRHRSDGVEIEIEGGLRPGLVYRVTVAPVLKDLVGGNPMAVPFEWVFSTGDSIRPNAIVGAVWDGETGEPVEGALVEVRRASSPEEQGDAVDTFPYTSRTDSVGIFALRYLPDGLVDFRAFRDDSRDDSLDVYTEPFNEQRFSLGAADTLPLTNVPLLVTDTSAAEVRGATILDSLTIRVETDDPLDPRAPISEVAVELLPATDSSGAVLEDAVGFEPPAIEQVFHEAGFAAWVDSIVEVNAELAEAAAEAAARLGAAPDSLLADTVPPDSAGAAVAGEPSEPADPGPAAPSSTELLRLPLRDALDLLPDGTTIPKASFVVRLAAPLPADVPFDVIVRRLVNLGQRGGGQGTARVRLPAPEPPPEADTAGVAIDTLVAR